MRLHLRLTVAKWLDSLSLGTRLSFVVAVVVFAVVTSVSYLEVRSYEGHIDHDLTDAASLAARSAADTLDQRAPPFDPLDVRDALHDLVASDPVLDAISVIERDPGGELRVFTSTSTEEREEVLTLAGRALAARAPAGERSSTLLFLAVPVPHRGNYAVAVTVGLESLLQARDHELRVALGFALPTIVLVTILVNLIVRRLVSQPLRAILGTMTRNAEGDFRARAAIIRRDEIGTIGAGLNEMLDQLQLFNQSLYDKVREATSDLSVRNQQLAASQSELLTLRESLAHTERVAALGQVAANVAHQAGTPLNLVSGYVQMIRDDPRTDERTRARLVTVDAQIQQVTRVLRTMLDNARRPSGLAHVDLGRVIERVRELAQPRLERAGIRLHISVTGDLPAVKADATQLEMALLNLVTNALDAMPHGGSLAITAETDSAGARMRVADTGGGIPAAVVDRLFEPWVTTKPAGQGSGLGLAIVRDVVRAHGGSIAASNQAGGAVFVITLPAAASGRDAS